MAAAQDRPYEEIYFYNNLMQAKRNVENYPIHKEMIESFLTNFESSTVNDARYKHKKYLKLIQDLANMHSDTLVLDTNDILHWCKQQKQKGDKYSDFTDSFMGGIMTNTMRYQEFAYKILVDLIPEPDHNVNTEPSNIRKFYNANHFRAIKKQIDAEELEAQQQLQQANNNNGNNIPHANLIDQNGNIIQIEEENRKKNSSMSKEIPLKLMFPYQVVFKQTIEKIGNMSFKHKMRNLRADLVGRLVTFDGIITKVSAVKPKLEVATYKCSMCDHQIFQEITSDEFMPLIDCPTQICKDNKTTGLHEGPQLKSSQLCKYQELKIQEHGSEVPVGSIPRQMNIVVKGDMTRTCLPGEAVTVTGVYIPHVQQGPSTGGKVQTSMWVHAHDITQHKRGYKEDENSYEYQKLNREIIKNQKTDKQIYEKLAYSIAPQIFGMEDCKKALLLLLVGGCTRGLQDGMKIRGDIHLLFMGDPGVAKSQLLKQVSILAPRSVYTTGKGSSGAGLTAAVTRDPQTSEVHLEGGALVLADSGVCCIDEFDKMEENDRTAIHEVMEQQTISIAKAGITTTLNARTSVLAAANPVDGRYNERKSPVENIGLPAALLSRFDLKWLLLDKVDAANDINLARHVIEVHRNGDKDPSKSNNNKGNMNSKSHSSNSSGNNSGGGSNGGNPGGSGNGVVDELFDSMFLRAYIKRAKTFEPLIPRSLEEKIVMRYVDMRQKERDDKGDERKDYVTPRQLLGMIRLGQALARIRFSNVMSEQDWEEALRLVDASKASILSDEEQKNNNAWADDLNNNNMDDENANNDAVDPVAMARNLENLVGADGLRAMGGTTTGGARGNGNNMMNGGNNNNGRNNNNMGGMSGNVGSGDVNMMSDEECRDRVFDILSECFTGLAPGTPVFLEEILKKTLSTGLTEENFENGLLHYVDQQVFAYSDATKKALVATDAMGEM